MLVAEGLQRPVIRAAATRALRVLVVDDDAVVRNGMRWLLTRVSWVEYCESVAAARDAHGFDVALVDVGLGLALCERLSAHARVALLTSRWDLVPMRTARAAGASGVIEKERPARELLGAVHTLASGGTVEPAPPAPGEVRFIPREREILRLVGAGLTNAEIGAAMFLAPGTIKHHMLEIYEKLGAPNRAAAVHTARRLGVLADTEPPIPQPKHPVRVLVIDPRDVYRTGVLLALRRLPWVEECAGARTEAEAVAVAERLRPDVTLSGDEIVRRRGPAVADPVSPRERDVLTALATGATNSAIARALGLSPNTVKQHASSIFRKLGVRNRAEAVRRADELGLLAA
ncbi:MAG TPA: LuxR C-terminal-related transcriptional regulator [Solirubrobacter sp.]|nr:LuxR C-terminal-related transcriptional regulator [Solirubrobacter sp.]